MIRMDNRVAFIKQKKILVGGGKGGGNLATRARRPGSCEPEDSLACDERQRRAVRGPLLRPVIHSEWFLGDG